MTGSHQCAILAGGSGTRLGQLTKQIPKPLLPVGARPFLAHLIHEVARHGFSEILLLAGTKAEAFELQLDVLRAAARQPVDIKVLREPEPLGTGGAVKAASRHLKDEFLLLNGDSFFDLNLLDLAAPLPEGRVGRVALKPSADVGRYGAVTLEGECVTSFTEKGAVAGHGLINGGVYWLHRSVIDDVGSGVVSLETDVLPHLAKSGRLLGRSYDRFFIDIGIPEALQAAQVSVPEALSRPAVFLAAETLLAESGQSTNQPSWISDAIAAIRWLNDNGYDVFVLAPSRQPHPYVDEQLAARGAHINSYVYCSLDLAAAGQEIQDLASAWSVRRTRSFIVGDVRAAPISSEIAGLAVHGFDGGDLLQFIRRHCSASTSAKIRL